MPRKKVASASEGLGIVGRFLVISKLESLLDAHGLHNRVSAKLNVLQLDFCI